MRFRTRCIHAGQAPDPVHGSVVTPLHQSTTFAQSAPGEYPRYDYSRAGNPTRTTLEDNLAALEEAPGSAAFASGMAAISCLIHLLPAASHVICGENVYGGTHRIFRQVYEPMGYRFSFVDTRELGALEAAFLPETRLVLLETPTNPLMHVSDIAGVVRLCRARGVKLAVDNTFMTPYWQTPLALGADYVVHSATKYLGGHSDVVMGFLAPRDEADLAALRFQQKAVGAVPSPFDCWLMLRGLKTLAIRMEAHEANARAVAEFLVRHPKVGEVHWAGLAEHRGHDIQLAQAKGAGGGVLAFELPDLEAVRRFSSGLEVFTLAESLGAVESLCSIPSLMTHASVPPDHRKKLGIHDGLVRLSVGIEDRDDLLGELDRILKDL